MVFHREEEKTLSKKIKVSIIIPVYNVERYLNKCLDSVLGQTLKEIEVVAVDDGSVDKSGIILDEYAKNDSRVVVIHQQNRGYSGALESGLRHAHGYYVGIVEPDDFVDVSMYEKLYRKALTTKADIVKAGFSKYSSVPPRQNEYFKCPSGVDLRLAPKGAFSIEEWPQLIAFHSSIWSSIYKRDLFNHFVLPSTAGASYQDLPIMLNLMTLAKKIAIVPDGLYYWRNEPDQKHSTNANGKKLLLMLKNSETGIAIVNKSGKISRLMEALYVHIVWANLPFLFNIKAEYKREYFEGLYKLLYPLKDNQMFKFEFFQRSDRIFFRLLMLHNYPLMKCGLWMMGLRRRIKKVVRV